MKNWHEWNMLTWEIFESDYVSKWDNYRVDKNAFRGAITFAWAWISAALIILPAAIVSDVVFDSIWLFLASIPIAAYITYKAPILQREHVLYGITGSMRRHAEFYYTCNKAERTFYPVGIEEMFRTNFSDVDWREKNRFIDGLDSLERDIEARRKAYNAIVKPSVDLSSAILQMKNASDEIRNETKIYRGES